MAFRDGDFFLWSHSWYNLYALVLLQKLCKNCLHPKKLHLILEFKWISNSFRPVFLNVPWIKGGDPIEFKKINDAYNKLIGHVNKLDAIESEAELSRTSVIIEISKQAVPKWKEKLKAAYGLPKTSKVNNVLFNVSLFTKYHY